VGPSQEVYRASGRLFNIDVVVFRWIITSKIRTKLSSDAFIRLKLCQKCVCGQALPGLRWGSLYHSLDPIAGFGEWEEGKGRGGEGSGEKERGP